jgi:Delta3,5-Delta2,4-dienoyl-CoA isomerase
MSQLQGYSGLQHFLVSSPAEYVAHVQINRPEKLNAFFEAMWVELGDIFKRLSHDPQVRAVVLSAVGDKAFTAGLDVQAASTSGPLGSGGRPELDGARQGTLLRRHILEFQDHISQIEKCAKRES